MGNTRGRPRDEIRRYRSSFSAPSTFGNTLTIVGCKIPGLKRLSVSQQIVRVLEMVANGDLGLTDQYKQKQKGVSSIDTLE